MKTVLITGTSSGFGYLTAFKFAKAGYKVFATARDVTSKSMIQMKEIALKEKLDIEQLEIDVTNQETIDNVTHIFKKRRERIDVLVNNAGYGILGPIETFSVEDIERQMNTNFLGVVRMVKSFLPLMREQGGGMIINISSASVNGSIPFYGVYAASKAAVDRYSQALRSEVRQFGIKVAMVEPGGFNTHFGKNVEGLDEEKIKETVYGKWFKKLTAKRKALKIDTKKGIMGWLRDPKWVVNKVYRVANTKNPP